MKKLKELEAGMEVRAAEGEKRQASLKETKWERKGGDIIR